VYFFFKQLDHFVKLSSTYFSYLGYVLHTCIDLCFLKLNIGNKFGLCSMLKKCPGMYCIVSLSPLQILQLSLFIVGYPIGNNVSFAVLSIDELTSKNKYSVLEIHVKKKIGSWWRRIEVKYKNVSSKILFVFKALKICSKFPVSFFFFLNYFNSVAYYKFPSNFQCFVSQKQKNFS
jgi:hypothetical protein